MIKHTNKREPISFGNREHQQHCQEGSPLIALGCSHIKLNAVYVFFCSGLGWLIAPLFHTAYDFPFFLVLLTLR